MPNKEIMSNLANMGAPCARWQLSAWTLMMCTPFGEGFDSFWSTGSANAPYQRNSRDAKMWVDGFVHAQENVTHYQ